MNEATLERIRQLAAAALRDDTLSEHAKTALAEIEALAGAATPEHAAAPGRPAADDPIDEGSLAESDDPGLE